MPSRRDRAFNIAGTSVVGIGAAVLMRMFLMSEVWQFAIAILALGVVTVRLSAVASRRLHDEETRRIPWSERTSRPYGLIAVSSFIAILASVALIIVLDMIIPLF